MVAGVLIGGQSRRMGSSKALLPHGAGCVLEHVVAEARRVAGEVVLVGEMKTLPASLRMLTQIRDEETGGGPLAGLCALLSYAGRRWTLLLACDLPLLTSDTLELLVRRRSQRLDAVAFEQERGWHACCALYHPRLLDKARDHLHAGTRSLNGLLVAAQTLTVRPGARTRAALFNLNTPEDMAHLAALGEPG